MKGNDDAEHAQELPADFESKGLSGGDQSAEDGYGTGPAVPCEPNLIAKWKKQALADLPEIFRQPHNGNHAVAEAEKDELFKQIGQLKVELEWLKKRSGFVDRGEATLHCSSSASNAGTAMRFARFGHAPLSIISLPARARRTCA